MKAASVQAQPLTNQEMYRVHQSADFWRMTLLIELEMPGMFITLIDYCLVGMEKTTSTVTCRHWYAAFHYCSALLVLLGNCKLKG